MRCVFISRAAAGMVKSGPTVIASVVISSPAVSAGCSCLCGYQLRVTSARVALPRSDS